jgi:hypothetical protein
MKKTPASKPVTLAATAAKLVTKPEKIFQASFVRFQSRRRVIRGRTIRQARRATSVVVPFQKKSLTFGVIILD